MCRRRGMRHRPHEPLGDALRPADCSLGTRWPTSGSQPSRSSAEKTNTGRMPGLRRSFGVSYSVYLTVVSLTILESACPYCLRRSDS